MRTPIYMHSRNVVAMRKPFSMLQPSKHTEKKQGCGRKAPAKWATVKDTRLDIVRYLIMADLDITAGTLRKRV